MFSYLKSKYSIWSIHINFSSSQKYKGSVWKKSDGWKDKQCFLSLHWAGDICSYDKSRSVHMYLEGQIKLNPQQQHRDQLKSMNLWLSSCIIVYQGLQ